MSPPVPSGTLSLQTVVIYLLDHSMSSYADRQCLVNSLYPNG